MNTIIAEATEQGEVAIDIYQKLANGRILFISDFIDDKVATDITATLLLKNIEDDKHKISLIINSNGGDIRSVFMIYDMINIIAAPVETVCVGSAIGEAVILLAAGAPGMRMATKNSIIAVNQLTYDWTNYSDLADAKEVLNQSVADNKKMMEILAKRAKKSLKQVMSDFDRRVFMNANQAAQYGIIDKIVIK